MIQPIKTPIPCPTRQEAMQAMRKTFAGHFAGIPSEHGRQFEYYYRRGRELFFRKEKGHRFSVILDQIFVDGLALKRGEVVANGQIK